ncbi:MAG: hypothetical protein BroJett038_11160 [Chloroflexota bacterium]|nr:MAG: hypothetical protein BroJett038_11160 [Chloroflexota bacterium]
MPQPKLTPQLLLEIVTRVPEGFISRPALAERFRVNNKAAKRLNLAAAEGRVGREGNLYYDATRLKPEAVRALQTWSAPQMPTMYDDLSFPDAPIVEQMAQRRAQLTGDELHLLERLADAGYMERGALEAGADNRQTLQSLIEGGMLKQVEDLVYDPLRLGEATIRKALRARRLRPIREAVVAFLQKEKGKTALRQKLDAEFDRAIVDELVAAGHLVQFAMTHRHKSQTIQWVTFKGTDEEAARRAAAAQNRIKDQEWKPFLETAGETLRLGARDGGTYRARVLARTYVLNQAAKRLGARPSTLEKALREGRIAAFTDPQGSTRFPAAEVERAYADSDYALRFTGLETLKVREIALVAGLSYSAARYRLGKEKISRTAPRWEQVQGKWGLPQQLYEFREILKIRRVEWRIERHAAYLEEQRKLEERYRQQQEEERRRRAELRALLLPVFPTWEYNGRESQQIFLHVGPPNSGKTHAALDELVRAGSGWYLAPLRLLALEVFDRLNERGAPCSLLTGEEYIPVEGARFTASTIEMFNPNCSGLCVVIDEAQMLADTERSWAWTRALMEAQAPEIHVIGPFTVRPLIERLAQAVTLPVQVIEHQRLAGIQAADRPFSLRGLPLRTILVAFSRATVLELKDRLENLGRSVSVIYGNLPPEVRRKQAQRFADGDTEICVATDAVGMGLNLPADYVCFFEVEKYDGQVVRPLTAAEVQQIGGRAGRFGLSQAGEVGAIEPKDHDLVRKLFPLNPMMLTYARVMPTVEALELLPGTLAERLRQWALLESIPDHLRSTLKTANLTEPVELAEMLQEGEVQQLGLERALKLINAPTRQNTRGYWRSCATSILAGRPMPLPPPPPREIYDQVHLEDTETSISCADIYLWLARRPEFGLCAPAESRVRAARAEWSAAIDAALLRRIEAARRCSRCGCRLPEYHPYGVCDTCYYNRRYKGFA